MTGEPGISLTELKTLQDWQVRRAFRRIPGVIDVTAFGGTTKEYPRRHRSRKTDQLRRESVSGHDGIEQQQCQCRGNYLTIGAQNYNVRGVGLINGIQDIENVMVAEKDGTPIYIRTLGR